MQLANPLSLQIKLGNIIHFLEGSFRSTFLSIQRKNTRRETSHPPIRSARPEHDAVIHMYCCFAGIWKA